MTHFNHGRDREKRVVNHVSIDTPAFAFAVSSRRKDRRRKAASI